MLDVLGASGSNYYVGWRKNGSTDNRTQRDYSPNWSAFCGVDSSRILELYRDATTPPAYRLIGYFGADSAVFFTNLTEKSPATAATWCDLDLSGLVGTDEPVAALFELHPATGHKYGLRCNGSTDDHYDGTLTNAHRGAITALDASHVCEGKRQTTDDHFWVNGYIKACATFTVNMVLQDVVMDSAWHDLGALPANAIGGFYQVHIEFQYDMRKKGSSVDSWVYGLHGWRAVQCDANRIVQLKMAAGGGGVYLIGYAWIVPDATAAVGGPAAVSVAALVPSVGAVQNGTVEAVTAAVSVAAPVPSAATTRSPTILAVAGAVSVATPSPSATTTRSPIILAVAGALSVAALVPVPGVIQNPVILAVTGALQVTANLPNRAGITFISPVDITPAGGSGWQDVNLSAYVPPGTVGVILDVIGASGGYSYVGWRKNGSTDNRSQLDYRPNWTAFCGVDASRILELCKTSTPPPTYAPIYRLIGYFDADSAVFFTNAPERTPAGNATWGDLDLSGLVVGDDEPLAAMFELYPFSVYQYGLRCNGSTDDHYAGTGDVAHRGAITALDASHVCEGKKQTAADHFYVNGYIKANVEFTVNMVLQDVVMDSAWHDLGALPANAIGGFYQVHIQNQYDMRKKGSALEGFFYGFHGWRAVQCDANRIVQLKMAAGTGGVYLMGYAWAGFGVWGTTAPVVSPPAAVCQVAAPIPTVQTTAESLTTVPAPAGVYLAAPIPDPVIERNAEAVSPVATLAVEMSEPITTTSGNVTEFLWPAVLLVALPVPTLFAGVAPAIEAPAAALALAGPTPTVTAVRNALTESRTSTILVSAPVPSAECMQQVTLEAPTADLSLVAQVPPAVTTGAWSLIQAPLAALVTAALEAVVTAFRLPLGRTLQRPSRLKLLSQRSEAVLSPYPSRARFRTLRSEVVIVR